ncbi:nitrate reductase subunit beta [Mesosutterella sp. OilRF-GAM-744-9]|uniref:Nitrate reductase subunit beta n=1 Tax=Mesosutterella porci TaxID=2915351 RepID=A0ABS9MQP1_9BURK|nr:nitrate reductase subunit beta [Mesosutterella sp. oilRF-744-WT-GAM-9]MCG5030942.1 nitrate reductase subunit beta [Mesosutterella sp. oilRF-744-WT-GAM-9]
MKVQAQICMVLNLDKCIGCHTCSVTCKNVWTSRRGMEYAWFNNVETKPGVGYPKSWEDQEKYRGGWVVKNGRAVLRHGGRAAVMSKLFSNPSQPQVNDYYEPFTFDYERLKESLRTRTAPSARPYSLVTGRLMDTVKDGPNWEDNLAGPFAKRRADPDLRGMDTAGFEAFEASFMYYLPRLCEHCLHPACAASCPSGAIYKRAEDGIVLINQDKCRGWRQCISACPYKKIYFNPARSKSEKCVFCYPRLESGEPTLCAESCVGRIRYMGVVLFDASRIDEYACADEKELYEKQLSLILDPNDAEVIRAAREQGVADSFLEAAKKSPVYKMMKDWKIAFPLHPEYRTMPMVWYVPPLSPLGGQDIPGDFFAKLDQMRIPVRYMARLLTAGDEKPIRRALMKLMALRAYMRSKTVEGCEAPAVPPELGLSTRQYEDMYRYLAIADYEDRFVIPTAPAVHEQTDLFSLRAGLGFEDEEGCRTLFGGR